MTQTQMLATTELANFDPQFDVELAPLTYMKIGGPAEVLIDAKTDESVVAAVQFAQSHQLPLTVLAGASNVIVDSAGLKGVVIRMATDHFELLEKVGDRQIVQASAGIRTSIFVSKTVASGLTGLEYFLGVPGRLGGAIYNNAHYLADLIGEHVHQVEVVTRDGQRKWLSRDECQFAYDYSVFHRTEDIILNVQFALEAGTKENSQALIKEATEYRAKTQPLGEPSSGCYFRNTANTDQLRDMFPQYADRREFPSAFLIDQAGLKEKQVGGVKVSSKHAAFFINTGNGTSQDVSQLAALVQETILAKFGVELQPEVFHLSTR